MKILSMEIENFLAITSATLSLADRGLVLIQGENMLDSSALSNGSGKSSLADALCWAIYGVTARGASGNEVVNEDVGKNCRVKITILDDDGTEYDIIRHRKHGVNKNAVLVCSRSGATTADLTKGTDKLTQDTIVGIIGTSLEVFRGSIYAGQEMMPDLPAMTDKQLKMLIEEAAGIEILEKSSEIARGHLKTENFTLQSIKNELDKASDRVNHLENLAASIETDEANWKAKQVILGDELQVKAKNAIAELRGIKDKLANTDKPMIERGIADIQLKLSAMSSGQSKAKSLANIASEKANKLTASKANFAVLEKQLANLSGERGSLANKTADTCSQCGQAMDETHVKKHLGQIDEQMANLEAKVKKYAPAIEALTAEVAAAQKEAKEYEERLADPSKLMADLKTLQEKLSEVVAIENHHALISQSTKRIADQIKALKTAVSPYAEQREKAKNDLLAAETIYSTTHDRLKSQETVCLHREAVVRVFDPAGIRARILDDVTPYLNAQTEKYLSALSDGHISAIWTTLSKGANGTLKEKFSIEVEKDKGAKSFRGLSGGEKRKVRIAGALALQDLVSTRASKPIDLFIGDEIDDALDAAGLERLTMILEEKAKERGSVFVISHNEMRDHIDQVLTVQKLATGETNIIEA